MGKESLNPQRCSLQLQKLELFFPAADLFYITATVSNCFKNLSKTSCCF